MGRPAHRGRCERACICLRANRDAACRRPLRGADSSRALLRTQPPPRWIQRWLCMGWHRGWRRARGTRRGSGRGSGRAAPQLVFVAPETMHALPLSRR